MFSIYNRSDAIEIDTFYKNNYIFEQKLKNSIKVFGKSGGHRW